MDKELQTAAKEFAQKMLNMLDKGVDFTAEQIPLVIQEKLHFDLAMALFWVLFSTILIIGFWRASRKLQQSLHEDCWWAHPGPVFLFAVPTLVFGVVWLYNAEKVVYITLAPRLYIIEWLRGLL